MSVNLSDVNFKEEVLEAKTPVLVDFWAPWCRPCNVLGETLAEVEKACPQCKVGKLNIDENQQTTGTYSVNAIPTLLFFKAGKEVKRLVGLQEAKLLIETLQEMK